MGKQANVLVHCSQGINRSGAVVTSFLMVQLAKGRRFRKCPIMASQLFKDAWLQISAQRWPVLQQQSFRMQLRMWGECCLKPHDVVNHPLWKCSRCFCCFKGMVEKAMMAQLEEVK